MFLERRTRAEEKEKAQKIIQIVFSTVFLFGFIVPGLDKRFGWSEIPVSAVLTADIIILLGNLLIFFVFRQKKLSFSKLMKLMKVRCLTDFTALSGIQCTWVF